MTKKSVIITLSESNVKNLSSVVKSLEKAGFEVENKFEYGVITGKIDENMIDKLSKRKSIESISEEKFIQLPPSDFPIQ